MSGEPGFEDFDGLGGDAAAGRGAPQHDDCARSRAAVRSRACTR